MKPLLCEEGRLNPPFKKRLKTHQHKKKTFFRAQRRRLLLPPPHPQR